MENQLIQEFLSRKTPTTEKARFNFAVPETVDTDLLTCYAYNVRIRGMAYIATSDIVRVVNSVSKWLKNGRQGLILHGKVGTGKSIMLQAIAMLIDVYNQQYPENKRIGMQVSAASEVCEAAASKNEDDQVLVRRLKNCSYAGIDDLGTEALTVKSWGTELSPILDILYSRYDNQKLTVITTNDSMEGLRKKYGERIYDRFCEMYDRVTFDFESFR